jgi:hypothetical protein
MLKTSYHVFFTLIMSFSPKQNVLSRLIMSYHVFSCLFHSTYTLSLSLQNVLSRLIMSYHVLSCLFHSTHTHSLSLQNVLSCLIMPYDVFFTKAKRLIMSFSLYTHSLSLFKTSYHVIFTSQSVLSCRFHLKMNST